MVRQAGDRSNITDTHMAGQASYRPIMTYIWPGRLEDGPNVTDRQAGKKT
jgi:hypothetical protein